MGFFAFFINYDWSYLEIYCISISSKSEGVWTLAVSRLFLNLQQANV